MKLPMHLQSKLNERKAQHAYRQLSLPETNLIDFCSNDYLGIVKNRVLINKKQPSLSSGSTGSRLLTGNYGLIEETEQQIAAFHQAEAALLFNSGYDANLGVLSCIPQKGDTIIYDSLCHASIRDGIRLSFAKAFSFLHNDIDDLQKKLRHATGNRFIITESVFSMDGDVCPLHEIILLCKEYKAYLILDEAHAIGIIGDSGEGLAQYLQLHTEVFCRIYTFGKACGCHGAVAVGSMELRNYLINFSRNFIYSTAMPEHSVYFIQKSYQVFPKMKQERQQLKLLIEQFAHEMLPHRKTNLQTPIQTILIAGNENVKNAAKLLKENKLDVRPILYPTVPKGSERLRIILHAFNTSDAVKQLTGLIRSLN